LLYGCVFVLAGAGLLAATYALFKHSQTSSSANLAIRSTQYQVPKGIANVLSVGVTQKLGAGRVAGGTATANRRPVGGVAGRAVVQGAKGAAVVHVPSTTLSTIRTSGQRQLVFLAALANRRLRRAQANDASTLLEWSAIALALVALLSVGLAWWLAGRALRPLRTMNARAREISAENLHQRLGVDERRDELGELATTFDGLLSRLEAAFDSQRRFVANASHELRTPITLERTLAEVALADPDASVDALRRVCERIVASTEEQERLLDALLTLARSEAGLSTGESVDLATVVEDALLARETRLVGITVESSLEPATVIGDQALLERLVSNLVENAIVHNSGSERWLRLFTGEVDGAPVLRIANGGDPVDPERIGELFEPFRRGMGERLGAPGGGLGLGLSIVSAVAAAHGAQIDVAVLPDGGLEFALRFARAGARGPRSGGVEPVPA
jgi:signal transduction histidine kinase